MKIISIERATLLRYGVMLRPEGQLYLPSFADEIAKRFAFVSKPNISTEVLEGLEFSHGAFLDFAIGKLGVYNDGVVVRSQTHSKQLDDFLAVFIDWSKETFGLVFTAASNAGPFYSSTLVVHSEKDLMSPLKKLLKLEKSLADKLARRSNVQTSWSLTGYVIGIEQGWREGFTPAPFRLERRAASDVNAGHYLSEAPLATEDHVELLREIEALS